MKNRQLFHENHRAVFDCTAYIYTPSKKGSKWIDPTAKAISVYSVGIVSDSSVTRVALSHASARLAVQRSDSSM